MKSENIAGCWFLRATIPCNSIIRRLISGFVCLFTVLAEILSEPTAVMEQHHQQSVVQLPLNNTGVPVPQPSVPQLSSLNSSVQPLVTVGVPRLWPITDRRRPYDMIQMLMVDFLAMLLMQASTSTQDQQT